MLPQTMVVPLQPELPRLLSTTASASGWVMTITLLVGAVSMPVSGKVADLVGRRPVLVMLAGSTALGSAICASSDNLWPVLAGRAFQGVGMGFMPVALATIRQVAPVHLAGLGVAAMSATMGVGAAVGLPLAAVVLEYADWHLLFWGVAAAECAAIAAIVALVPAVSGKPGRFDAGGAMLLTLGMTGLLLGISQSTTWGWSDARTLGSVGVGLLVLLGWGVFERAHATPLVDMRLTARRPVLLTNIAAVAVGFGTMGTAIVLPHVLLLPVGSGGLGLSMLATGLYMAPGGIVMLVVSPLAGRLLTDWGPARCLTGAAAAMCGGYVIAAVAHHHLVWLQLASIAIAVGTGVAYAAMPTLVMDHMPAADAGAAVGVNALMRSVGTTTSSAVLATMLVAGTSASGGSLSSSAVTACFVAAAAVVGLGAVIAGLIPQKAAVDGGPVEAAVTT